MDARARDLIKQGDKLFDRRSNVLSLWQEIADAFYPERAEFTTLRSVGEEFAAGMMTSFPALVRRELGNLFASLLRPRGQEWFSLHAVDEDIDDDVTARQWLEYATKVQKRAMYEPSSMFVRASRESDHDFATFGNAVKSIEVDWQQVSLLYRAWHLRDCAWCENLSGRVDTMHRKWKAEAKWLVDKFPLKAGQQLKERASKDPYGEVTCRHIVVPADQYEHYSADRRNERDFRSVYLDIENETVLEDVAMDWFQYVVPRWQTVSGSAYARSPVTELCLPDARLLQAMVRVLLEAGEKGVDPPSIAGEETFRSDMNLYAGGVTFAALEVGESLNDKFKQLQVDKTGIPLGINMAERIEAALQSGFFLNKLGLPELVNKDMTAYQVRKIVENHVRQSAPIFEPIEEEDNAATCNLTFDILRSVGAFGPAENVPEVLQDTSVNFSFMSPLREVANEMKGQQLQEAIALTGAVAQIEPAAVANINWIKAHRDSLQGIRIPADWMSAEEIVEQVKAQMNEQARTEAGAAAMGEAANVAKTGGEALKAFTEAGVG
jgi:hypothetical protein